MNRIGGLALGTGRRSRREGGSESVLTVTAVAARRPARGVLRRRRAGVLVSALWGLAIGMLASVAYTALIAATHWTVYRQGGKLLWFAALCLAGGAALGLLGGFASVLVPTDRPGRSARPRPNSNERRPS